MNKEYIREINIQIGREKQRLKDARHNYNYYRNQMHPFTHPMRTIIVNNQVKEFKRQILKANNNLERLRKLVTSNY